VKLFQLLTGSDFPPSTNALIHPPTTDLSTYVLPTQPSIIHSSPIDLPNFLPTYLSIRVDNWFVYP